MIPLRLEARIEADADFVCRVGTGPGGSDVDAMWEGQALVLPDRRRVEVPPQFRGTLDGDVLFVQPTKGTVERLVRADSKSNFFLVTEQCDQLCLMCSQPPKKSHFDRFSHFEKAALLAPSNSRITITGGEPTLHKTDLFRLVERTYSRRPDVSFHVLSNGQHLTEDDLGFLRSPAGQSISWGIPLYAADASLHDEIVGKAGAWNALLGNLALLCRSGGAVELRTVVLTSNTHILPTLARFIAANIPFAAPWALMQLENIGFAKHRWPDLFFDSSTDFRPIGEAIDTARLAGVRTSLYNFPLCTVPAAYRRFALSTISDWKKRYLTDCVGCPAKPHCGGFFEWYPDKGGFERIGFE